jgi:uncharacterized protein (DUF2141 family)
MPVRKTKRQAPQERFSRDGGLGLVIFLLLFSSCAYGQPAQATQQSGRLHVVVTGLGSDAGQVRIALFDSEESYVNAKKPFKTAAVNIRNKRAECLLEGIPFNTYAIRVYHDENGNGKLDRADYGPPLEPYGFSNNARGFMGPAKWSAAKFQVKSRHTTMEINLE